MEITTIAGIRILQFHEINTLHGFTARSGGVSEGGYASLNFGRHSGDDASRVEKNFERLFHGLGIDASRVAMTSQSHSNHIRRIDGQGHGGVHEDTDGLMTNVPGMVLVTFYADCTPLYFYDPKHRVVAMAHAGWRGTLNGIARDMVRGLHREYGVRAGDLVVGIGPNLSKERFEVGPDFPEDLVPEEDFSRYLDRSPGRITFDMAGCNSFQLQEMGVLQENIHLSNLCTYDEKDLFFSYRRQGRASGRMAGFIGLGEKI
ncbi:MAG: hypothetical protein AVO33_02710 [delta proteobacterium ML8_F1]|nr:MAG: hypothetical protein AVO33_02710 [delta proteobacterium ML8_F1]